MYPYEEEEEGDLLEKRRQRDPGGRDQSDVATSQGAWPPAEVGGSKEQILLYNL